MFGTPAWISLRQLARFDPHKKVLKILRLFRSLCFRKHTLLLETQFDRRQLHPTCFLVEVTEDLQLDHGAAGILHVPCRSAGAGPDVAVLVEFDLAGVADAKRQWKLDEVFGLWIEAVESVVARTADPDHPVGSDVEGVGNLVEIIWQRISRPLLGLRIELAKDTRAKPGDPDHAIGRNMETARAAEGRIPLCDLAIG